jgi:hypothetical protein
LIYLNLFINIVGVFLPTIHGTSVDFIRDILSDKKSHLKVNEVIHLEVPSYNELSVKNLYNDALADPELQKYLPSKKQVSNKFPEKTFFFGILCTLRRQYMKDIIRGAQDKRYKAEEGDDKKDSIQITEAWIEQLNKHPYYSRNSFRLTFNR